MPQSRVLSGQSGSAGGGGARDNAASRSLLMSIGIVALAAGGSWGFYYLMRPPRD